MIKQNRRREPQAGMMGGAPALWGRFPRRAVRLVLEWYELRREELTEDWLLAEQRKPLKKVAPLEW
jgi:hypothetical protein